MTQSGLAAAAKQAPREKLFARSHRFDGLAGGQQRSVDGDDLGPEIGQFSLSVLPRGIGAVKCQLLLMEAGDARAFLNQLKSDIDTE